MKIKNLIYLRFLIAALLISGAAIYASAQTTSRPNKQNTREETKPPTAAAAKAEEATDDARYSYEFKQPDFLVSQIRIEHDARGRGQITFLRKGQDDPFTEEFELSPEALSRVRALWEALKFLETETDYQSEKQYPHLGTVSVGMKRNGRSRTATWNWTNEPSAKALANEYWRAADQAILVFDISVSRENLPLEAPKLMDRLDLLLTRGGLSDPKQLVPLLRDLSTDERVPLIARNHAGRLLKKIEK